MDPREPVTRDLVAYLMGRASRGMDRAWLVHLREHGMTIGQWQVLAILAEYDGSRLGQLARMSGTEQPVASRVVDQLERDGLVRREPAPEDGRAVEIWLTRAGRRVFRAMLPAAGSLVTRATDGLDDDAVNALTAALTVMIGNLEQSAAPQPVTHARSGRP